MAGNASDASDKQVSAPQAIASGWNVLSEPSFGDPIILNSDSPTMDLASHNGITRSVESPTRPCTHRTCGMHDNGEYRVNIVFDQSDTVLVMFYLEHVLPFLFPFYQPSIFQGGRAWILKLILSNAVVRQATICQSSYFFAITRGTACGDPVWDAVLKQTRTAFELLRKSLEFIAGSTIAEHLPCAVRIMSSIIQVQRFEMLILSFDDCQAHLDAAQALFRQLLDSSTASDHDNPRSKFEDVIARLGPPASILPDNMTRILSAEQAAFAFSSALLIFDDIIASTILQEQPQLYDYHHGLLVAEGREPINLEAVIGCQNWVLLLIGEIAALDAWKQRCKRAGNLDMMEPVHRATAIRTSLGDNLMRLETDPIVSCSDSDVMNILAPNETNSKALSGQSSVVTRVWAHAALIYLSVVVSGWQPANAELRCHVCRVLDLVTCSALTPSFLRTMVWPFCVAGCFAEPNQEHQSRKMVEGLSPSSIFGTVRKALEIMEEEWQSRDAEDISNRDLASTFRSQGKLILLL